MTSLTSLSPRAGLVPARAGAVKLGAGLGVSLAIALSLAGPARADEQVVLGAAKDNTLYEDALGEFSNGIGEHMVCGTTLSGGQRRALVEFDIASMVPAGSTITSVALRLNMSRTVALSQTCSIFRVTKEWGEGTSDAPGEEGSGAPATPGDATWLHAMFATDFWAAPGGDFAAIASAAIPVTGNGPYTWGSTAAMVADVQSWLDDPSSNHGWIVLGNEVATRTSKRWDSRENLIAANRPALTVQFVPPCPIDYVPDGMIDFLDYLEFLNRYDSQDPSADLNHDGMVDFADYLEFLNLYDGGC
ncbi:MAG: EF-hand domain-containing protein [Phycisphaerales bacterium]|nr:EF-hand domain-containing protein [Phycisphaerales bacterium]